MRCVKCYRRVVTLSNGLCTECATELCGWCGCSAGECDCAQQQEEQRIRADDEEMVAAILRGEVAHG